jgi:DNA-binding MarR family transcriptional regulator
MKGKHSEEARERMALSKDLEATVAEDAKTLRLMGQASPLTYAERVGCSEKTASNRLKRLVEWGYAERWRERDARSYRYTITIPPGAQLVNRKGPIQRKKDQEAGDA